MVRIEIQYLPQHSLPLCLAYFLLEQKRVIKSLNDAHWGLSTCHAFEVLRVERLISVGISFSYCHPMEVGTNALSLALILSSLPFKLLRKTFQDFWYYFFMMSECVRVINWPWNAHLTFKLNNAWLAPLTAFLPCHTRLVSSRLLLLSCWSAHECGYTNTDTLLAFIPQASGLCCCSFCCFTSDPSQKDWLEMQSLCYACHQSYQTWKIAWSSLKLTFVYFQPSLPWWYVDDDDAEKLTHHEMWYFPQKILRKGQGIFWEPSHLRSDDRLFWARAAGGFLLPLCLRLRHRRRHRLVELSAGR